MKQINGAFQLIRPLTSLTGAMMTILGGYVAGTEQWPQIILASLATFMTSASSIAWNDYLDVEIDRINQPQRAIPSGKVSLRTALLLSMILALGAISLSALISFETFLIALIINLLLYFYSWRLKSSVLLGNFLTAGISASSVLFGGVAAGNVRPTLLLAMIIFCGITCREILKVLADYAGDLQQGCRTVATVWGPKATIRLLAIFCIIMLAIMLLPYFANIYTPIYFVLVIFGIFPVVGYILFRVFQLQSGKQLERLSQFVKYYVFPLWFLAVLFGS